MRGFFVFLAAFASVVLSDPAVRGDEPARPSGSPKVAVAVDEALFRERVAPILESRCVRCHCSKAAKGGLTLDTAEGLARGGKGGPAVAPGKPGESLLLEMVAGESPEMPKSGKPLSRLEVASLRSWVEAGAHWPSGVSLRDRAKSAADWWAIKPLDRPKPPSVRDTSWSRTPIDRFVLARLEEKGLRPNPEADRRTLIRRLTFDFHGLPPTWDETQAFVADSRPDAYERLVERLLASPRYGERWGRFWLDIAHYGDTHGYDKDKRRDHAWPYRDYVIASFNDDLAYSRFVLEQVAGDVLWPNARRGQVATGFLAAGPWDFVGHAELREGTVDKLKARLIDRDDMLANTIATFNSLTVHCARCHDHKFDPIPQRDYYRLQAVFAGVDRGDRPCSPAVASNSATSATLPPWERAEVVYTVVSHAPRPIQLLYRGDVEQPREPSTPGALSCVPGIDADFVASADQVEGERRAALARWLASPRNALTWRSIANRVWQGHFGRGIVDTPSDFGRNGSAPTHPELLDWLAVELLENGQSLKSLHRVIVASAAYRQTSAADANRAAIDADNRLLWRMNRPRLDAEEIRDAVLAASGDLDDRMGGPGFDLFRFKDDHSPIYDFGDATVLDRPESRRRSVYRFNVRSVPNPFLECLDAADPNVSVPVRTSTITALQALAMLNDRFVLRASRSLAGKIESQFVDPSRRVDEACRRILGRAATPDEIRTLSAHTIKHGLADCCRILFNTSEFMFVD